jgi:ectoine hydroxylase-related dioxygenase (phytanoyl-CoA dioxygenase family)
MTASHQFAVDGFTVLPGVIDESLCTEISDRIEALNVAGAGSRRLLEQPWCVAVVARLRMNPAVQILLPEDAVAVQCTLFSKSLEKNWGVPPHQDLSIPVRESVESLECVGWSEKEGDLFVQPPVTTLERMVAIRIHVDACSPESGALRVTPRSHQQGRLNEASVRRLTALRGEYVVPVPRGGALVMRPLLLHASSKSLDSYPRRVLHFLFGPPALPAGLQWKIAV